MLRSGSGAIFTRSLSCLTAEALLFLRSLDYFELLKMGTGGLASVLPILGVDGLSFGVGLHWTV